MIVSPKQIKLGRIHLEWTQSDLAARAGVSKETIINIEKKNNSPQHTTFKKIISALEVGGIEFLDGDGLRERQKMFTYKGQNGFRDFMNDVYDVANTEGGEFRLHNAKPSNWVKWAGEDWLKNHNRKMMVAREKNNTNFRITSKMGGYLFPASGHAEYRWVPDKIFNQNSFYVYGDRLALLEFEDNNVNVFVIRKHQFADSFRHLFDSVWDSIGIIPDNKNLDKS